VNLLPPTHSGTQPLTLTLPHSTIDLIVHHVAEIVLAQLSERAQAESPYMTIPEAATYLRCKRQRIDDLLSARRLTRYKDGSRTLIARAELEAHLTQPPMRGDHADGSQR
jgi:excisionase family DNA binding protein